MTVKAHEYRSHVINRILRGSAVDEKTDCLEWQGALTGCGYGKIQLRQDSWKRTGTVHRAHWIAVYGHPPMEQWILHHCDNPKCCNLDHLFLGDNRINTADKMRKGRYKCLRGESSPQAKLTDSAIREIRDSTLNEKKLSEIHGVYRTVIGKIKRREIWRHVA